MLLETVYRHVRESQMKTYDRPYWEEPKIPSQQVFTSLMIFVKQTNKKSGENMAVPLSVFDVVKKVIGLYVSDTSWANPFLFFIGEEQINMVTPWGTEAGRGK